MQNPLKAEILSYLYDNSRCATEYEIIKMLEGKAYFTGLAQEEELALFQKHFITMNALYQIQLSLWESDCVYLDVTSVRVSIIQNLSGSDSCNDSQASALVESAAVREYYLDWSNYENTDQEEVLQMLNGFWEMYYSQDKIYSAYKTLELSHSEPFDVVKKQYRKLAAKYHPDKGGNSSDFIALRQAFEVIKQSVAFGTNV